MRKIKFRAWDKKNKCWYEPTHGAYRGELFELLVGFSGDLSAHTMAGLEHESMFPGRFILQQYIGRHDKNGKEIYEGDIVDGYLCGKGVVEWFDELGWDGGGSKHPGFYCHKWFEFGDEGNMEYHSGFDNVRVIGNIYDTPQLIPPD
jgi:uncharacterized phage protein (TIGR01671 family)